MEPIDQNTGFGAGSGDAASRGEPSTRKRGRTSTSDVLQHFETAPDNGNRICKCCRREYSMKTSKGNLKNHLMKCYPEYDNSQWGNAVQETCQAQPLRNITHSQVDPRIGPDQLNWPILMWMIGAGPPPPSMKCETLLNCLEFFKSSENISRKEKAEEAILEVFRTMREDVTASINQIERDKSFSVEFWTPDEQNKYMLVRCHWIDESWTLHKVLLDVCRLSRPCSYSQIDLVLAKVLCRNEKNRGLTFCTYTHEEDSEEDDKVNHIHVPCAVHLIKSLIDDCLKEMKPILSKIENFVLKLRSNVELMTTFKQSAVDSQEDSWKLPSDTFTSWYNEYIMLDLVRKVPHAMNTTIRKHINAFIFKEVSLNSEEKDKVNIVLKFLDIFYKTATELGRCKMPTLGLVLSLMDPILDMIRVSKEFLDPQWIRDMAEKMGIRADRYVEYFEEDILDTIHDPRIKIKLIDKFFRSRYTHEASRYTHQEIMKCVVKHMDVIDRGEYKSLQYLVEPTASMSTNILEWWKINSSRYPRLSHHARKCLTIQGISVRPEEELATNKVDDSYKQMYYCLSFDIMQAVLCINSWIENGYQFKFGGDAGDGKFVAALAEVMRVE